MPLRAGGGFALVDAARGASLLPGASLPAPMETPPFGNAAEPLTVALPPETGAMVSDMKLVGVFYIVFGALSCLSIIGAIAGIPMLLSGLRVREAADDLVRFRQAGDTASFTTAVAKQAGFFRMQKFYFFAALVLMVVGFVFYGLLIAYFVREGMAEAGY